MMQNRVELDPIYHVIHYAIWFDGRYSLSTITVTDVCSCRSQLIFKLEVLCLPYQ